MILSIRRPTNPIRMPTIGAPVKLELIQSEIKYLHELLEKEADRIRSSGKSQPFILRGLLHKLWDAKVHPNRK